jgi:hypothetical protein
VTSQEASNLASENDISYYYVVDHNVSGTLCMASVVDINEALERERH